jgi:hypothetical protein
MRSLRYITWFGLLFVLFFSGQAFATSDTSQPIKSIDSAQRDEVQTLAGEWEFYWQQLLQPDDFRLAEHPQSTNEPMRDFIQVPSSWVGQTLGKQTNGGQPLPRDGYATYRKLLQLQPEQIGVNSALFFRYVDSAFRIWIDGKEYDG